jgi:cytoskeleton protein RodZ
MASTSSFGEHLRREREMRGVSLEELSSATRISTRFLTAIESGQWEELPGGAFNRGYIRSASRYLGLDEDGMVAEYSLETNVAPANLPAASKRRLSSAARRRPRAGARKASAWTRFAMLAAAGIALIGGGWFAGPKIVHRLRARTAGAPARHEGFVRARTPSPRPSGPAAATGATAANPSAAPATPTAAPVAPAALALTVQAVSPSRVVVRADGKQVFQGYMRAKEQESFRAQQEFTISTNDARAVRLELNGQPVAPMGLAGQPGSITLTAKDAKPSTKRASSAKSSAGGNH